ncbi:hypothetical protein L0152_26000, partial [bacterium]|nr:hypothetical protein [bacterium]
MNCLALIVAAIQKKPRKLLHFDHPNSKKIAEVPFAALIHPQNPNSGPYGGMSFVIFPAKDAPCLIAMGVGTKGLSPDEDVLGRPGHA